MLDRAIVGLVLVALLFGLTCLCMGAIKMQGLEQRVDLLNKQVEEVFADVGAILTKAEQFIKEIEK